MKYRRKLYFCRQKYPYVTDSEKCKIISYKMSIYLHFCIVKTQLGPLQTTQNARLFWEQDCTVLQKESTVWSIPKSLGQHKNTAHFSLMLGQKATMTKWVGDEPPSAHLWKFLISDHISLERLRFCVKARRDLFIAKFGKVLEHLGTQSATVWTVLDFF